MPRSPDTVSWTAFNTVISALLTIGIGAVGAEFNWIHADLADIRTDFRDMDAEMRDVRTDTRDVHSDIRDMRTDIRDIRGSVSTINGRLQDTREDILKAIGGLEKQSALTNSKLDELGSTTRQPH